MAVGATGRAPTISFTAAGRRSQDIAEALNKEPIGIGYGDFFARRCIEALGLTPEDGVVRVGIAHYNDDGDNDRLLAALDRLLSARQSSCARSCGRSGALVLAAGRSPASPPYR